MKKKTWIKTLAAAAICCAALCAMSGGLLVSAEYLSLQIDNPNVYNGYYDNDYPLDSNDLNIMPILYEERTMLPLRAFAALLNFDGSAYYDIEWNPADSTALLYMRDEADYDFFEPYAKFQIGNTTAIVYNDGVESEITIPVAPTLINSRTYLPLRAVIDAISRDRGDGDEHATRIEWIGARQGIVIFLYGGHPSVLKFPDGTTIDYE